MERLPNHDLMHFVFLSYKAKGFNIELEVFPPKRRARLGGQKQGITDGYADGFIPDVESHNPHIFHDTILETRSTQGGSI
jgi:hypothetical protein